MCSPFIVTHYDHVANYDPGSFEADTSFLTKIRSHIHGGAITKEALDNVFADYLEDRELAFQNEGDLMEALQDVTSIASELLARLGARLEPP